MIMVRCGDSTLVSGATLTLSVGTIRLVTRGMMFVITFVISITPNNLQSHRNS